MQLRKRKEECVPIANPVMAPDYTEADVQALRAVAGGYATEDQQKRAMNFIIEDICGTYDFPFRPGPEDRETNIALGRQRAGQIIVWFLKTAETLTKIEKISARMMSRHNDGE